MASFPQSSVFHFLTFFSYLVLDIGYISRYILMFLSYRIRPLFSVLFSIYYPIIILLLGVIELWLDLLSMSFNGPKIKLNLKKLNVPLMSYGSPFNVLCVQNFRLKHHQCISPGFPGPCQKDSLKISSSKQYSHFLANNFCAWNSVFKLYLFIHSLVFSP
jgi:hypothetical protein